MADILDMTIFILKGLSVTLRLYIFTAILCLPLGLVFAIGKVSKLKGLRNILGIYTWIFRGTPLLLQLFFTYYGLPIATGISYSPFIAALITYTLNYGAYLTEIFRSGIESIDKGQYEASFALGMSYRQTMSIVVIPQALRRVIPPLCNEAINLVKDTALVAAIGMGDLLRSSKELVTASFTITPFIIAAILYLIFSSFVVLFFRYLEMKFQIKN